MMSAGSGPDGSPRTALKAASCSAKDRLVLKKRNGFSTSQSSSAAWLEPAARLANSEMAQAVARACPRIHPSQTHPPLYYRSAAAGGGEKFHLVEQSRMGLSALVYLAELHREYPRRRRQAGRRRGAARGRL